MRAIMVMFDSLNRRYLPSYGCEWTDMPNLRRLERRSAVFDRCYGGSMPCMPARRELHTGRYNFLHRSWGPLEPFDDSVPELLGRAGVYTHLVTDHPHYWEDGGATYHGRFNSFEFFRGQEGDSWKGQVADPDIPETVSWRRGAPWRQNWINRSHMQTVGEHSQALTVQAGIEFIETNHADDNWFLQIECFDPHEPFFTYDEYRDRYPGHYDGPHFDWPDYRRVVEDEQTVEHARKEYAALLSMCDDSLGRVLDTMDEHRLWDDTLLIVCTDHGLLLGEHEWWGKNVQPWYEENIHTPLFIWDPRTRAAGVRRNSLVQTIDFGPTLLDYFGLQRTPDMQGHALEATIADDLPVREGALFGVFGSHVCITDGRYVYMRAPKDRLNKPLFEHTLMPTHMNHRFDPAELRSAELVSPFTFTKGVPVLRVPGSAMGNAYAFGTLLFDLEADPGQKTPIRDAELERRMAGLLTELMRENDAPASQFERLGLPDTGPITDEFLLIEQQWDLVLSSARPPVPAAEFPDDRLGVRTTLGVLAADPRTATIVERALNLPLSSAFLQHFSYLDLCQLATMTPGVSAEDLRQLDRALAGAVADGEVGSDRGDRVESA